MDDRIRRPDMTKREKKYNNRKKVKRVLGWDFRRDIYDGSKIKWPNLDEPGFGMLLPKKEIKRPTKKEVKKKLYGKHNKGYKNMIARSPVTFGITLFNYESWLRATTIVHPPIRDARSSDNRGKLNWVTINIK